MSAIEREKKRLPFGWGRFGKALDYLAELLEPGEALELTAVGVYSDYRYQHVFGEFGAGLTNFLLGVTDRRLFVIATTVKGSPLDHHAIEWTDLTEFAVGTHRQHCEVRLRRSGGCRRRARRSAQVI